MNIEVKIVAPELAAAINNLAAAMGNRQLQAPETDTPAGKPKAAARSAKAKTTTPATSDQTEEAGPEAGAKAPAEESTASASTDQLDYSTYIKAPFLALAAEKGREVALELLAVYGVKSAQDVPEADWPALRVAIDEAGMA